MMYPPGFSGPYFQPMPWLAPAPILTVNGGEEGHDSFEGHSEEHSEGHGESGHSKFKAGLQGVKSHSTATVLMGAGTLLMNFIPSFRMEWPMAARFAAVNVAMMAAIGFAIGVYKAGGHGGHESGGDHH